MGRATLDFDSPPILTDAESAKLDAMTPDEIERSAREDPDNPPLTADELSHLRPLHPPRSSRPRTRRAG